MRQIEIGDRVYLDFGRGDTHGEVFGTVTSLDPTHIWVDSMPYPWDDIVEQEFLV
jgi:hypothetical protein